MQKNSRVLHPHFLYYNRQLYRKSFMAVCIQNGEWNKGPDKVMFTYNNFKRRVDMHVGRQLGDVDARVHPYAQAIKNFLNIDGTPHNS
jgi:hypothetical protein